jgi:hypothetical protein
MHLYEDLYAVGRSSKLRTRIDSYERVLNAQNLRVGIEARRGDGTFGELIPNVKAIADPGTEPYPFKWVSLRNTEMEYGAILTRICREYEERF